MLVVAASGGRGGKEATIQGNAGADEERGYLGETGPVDRGVVKKLILFAAMAGIIAVFLIFDLGSYLTLAYVKGSLARFRALYAQHPFSVVMIYFAVYVATTSLSLPGAVVLTIFGGALFGFLAGTVIVSFASTAGATLACFIARFLLRDWVQGKFGDKIVKVNEGIEREGAFYLFSVRLIPVFPFWMINLVMGLTKMPLWKFCWVSQIGMLAGTMVYVNAGKELSKIESLRGILSPGLLVSFALLGIFPLATRKILAFFRQGARKEGGHVGGKRRSQ